MRKIETYGNIVNGKLKIAKREQFYKAIEGMKDCRVKLIVQKQYKQRSSEQNRYYFGVIVDIWQNIIQDEWGEYYTAEQVHEFLKLNFNTKEVVCEQTGEILQVVKSTTENNTVEMEEYMEVCRRKALEMFNVIIPLPNEQTEADFTVAGH